MLSAGTGPRSAALQPVDLLTDSLGQAAHGGQPHKDREWALSTRRAGRAGRGERERWPEAGEGSGVLREGMVSRVREPTSADHRDRDSARAAAGVTWRPTAACSRGQSGGQGRRPEAWAALVWAVALSSSGSTGSRQLWLHLGFRWEVAPLTRGLKQEPQGLALSLLPGQGSGLIGRALPPLPPGGELDGRGPWSL